MWIARNEVGEFHLAEPVLRARPPQPLVAKAVRHVVQRREVWEEVVALRDVADAPPLRFEVYAPFRIEKGYTVYTNHPALRGEQASDGFQGQTLARARRAEERQARTCRAKRGPLT